MKNNYLYDAIQTIKHVSWLNWHKLWIKCLGAVSVLATLSIIILVINKIISEIMKLMNL